MRAFEFHDINEMGRPEMFMDNKSHPRFGCELGLLGRTNKTLIANFHKVCEWIEENCPHLNGEFECRHNPFYKIHLIVENGKAYLCTGSHSVVKVNLMDLRTYSFIGMIDLKNSYLNGEV